MDNEPTTEQQLDDENTSDNLVKMRNRIKALEQENKEKDEALGQFRTAEKHNRFAKAMGVESISGARAFMVNAYDGDLTEESINAFLVENGEVPASKDLQETIRAQDSIDELSRVSESSKPPSVDEDREAAYIAAYEAQDAEAMINLSLDKNPLTF